MDPTWSRRKPDADLCIAIQDRQRLFREGAAATPLTAREHEVLLAMAEGRGGKAMARRLGVAVKTIESHKFRIFEKLGVHNQSHAVSVAIDHGLLAGPASPSPDPGPASTLVGGGTS